MIIDGDQERKQDDSFGVVIDFSCVCSTDVRPFHLIVVHCAILSSAYNKIISLRESDSFHVHQYYETEKNFGCSIHHTPTVCHKEQMRSFLYYFTFMTNSE